jgi:hypothetical protein
VVRSSDVTGDDFVLVSKIVYIRSDTILRSLRRQAESIKNPSKWDNLPVVNNDPFTIYTAFGQVAIWPFLFSLAIALRLTKATLDYDKVTLG